MISERAQSAVDSSTPFVSSAILSSYAERPCLFNLSDGPCNYSVKARGNNAMSGPQKRDLPAEVKTLDVQRLSE